MVEKNTFDTIIIGAGIGGLTTGNLLAKNGQNVLILEKYSLVGGYVTTYKRKKYPMDVVHVICNNYFGVTSVLLSMLEGKQDWQEVNGES